MGVLEQFVLIVANDYQHIQLRLGNGLLQMRQRRLRQANLVGPAGYVSMEDGCVGGFVQRGVEGAPDMRAAASKFMNPRPSPSAT